VVNRRLEEELEAEFPQILNWIIEGCLRWQQTGLPRLQGDDVERRPATAELRAHCRPAAFAEAVNPLAGRLLTGSFQAINMRAAVAKQPDDLQLPTRHQPFPAAVAVA
jgi:hypothetical protein